MNMDSIGSAMMIIYDELKNDKPSKALIKQIDQGTNDSQIKQGLKKGIARLRELGKNALADDVEKKTKGFL